MERLGVFVKVVPYGALSSSRESHVFDDTCCQQIGLQQVSSC